ncbi:MAG: lipoprotein-releasing ABC transporter permease subunit [Rhodobacteraceae bacterium]|nr:lipoprotein-releasing ABC transporter permease subunit [Paracoccaceae bacterium]
MDTRPFSAFEWTIAWRYLRARRKEGGISVIAWYALIGVMLGVAALIVVQAVMIGFREEFTDRILGVNAHVTIYSAEYDTRASKSRSFADYREITAAVAAVPGVTRAAPIIKSQVMAAANGQNTGVQIYGESLADLKDLPLIANPESYFGDIEQYEDGVAIGSGIARALNLRVGDFIQLISPNGAVTPFGTTPRINDYEVVYIFRVGRADIDRARIYMPFAEAQSFFNREGLADEIEVFVEDPQAVDELRDALREATGGALIWTWRDANGAFLSALDTERRVMFIILSLVVLIAAMNIISGLVMLVKNKGRDIGILRTMGLTQGSIMRIFFICGSLIGIIGTLMGLALGTSFAYYIADLQRFLEWATGATLWNPEIKFLSEIPARLRLEDVVATVVLSLGLSLLITIFPARNAARLSPVEALRYE